MVLSNEISDNSILYRKYLSEIHNKLNCVRWEVDTHETRSQAVARIADRTTKNCRGSRDLGHAHF